MKKINFKPDGLCIIQDNIQNIISSNTNFPIYYYLYKKFNCIIYDTIIIEKTRLL